MSPARRTLSIWAALFAMAAAWCMLVPLRAQSDEPAHAIQAAAVVRGQVVVQGRPAVNEHAGLVYSRHEVEVPDGYAGNGADCILGHSHVSERCVAPIRSTGEVEKTYTPAANYAPLYYFAVGWPTLFLDGVPAWYAMRLLTALLCATIVTCGVVALARTYGIGTGIGSLAVFSPSAFSLFAAINPQSVEIALGFALAALFVCAQRRPRPLAIGIVAMLLALARPASAVWVVAIVLVGVIALRPDARRKLGQNPSWAVLAAAGAIAALAWNQLARPGQSLLGWSEPDMTFGEMASKMFGRFFFYWDGAFGNLGWNDNPVPAWLRVVSVVACAALALAALAAGSWRERAAILVGACLIPLSTLAMQYAVLRDVGIMWQGRYNLPLIVAVGVLCVAIVCRRWGNAASVPLLAITGFFFLLWAVRTSHRYGFGLGEGFFPTRMPLDHILALGLVAASLTLLARTHRAGRKPRDLRPARLTQTLAGAQFFSSSPRR